MTIFSIKPLILVFAFQPILFFIFVESATNESTLVGLKNFLLIFKYLFKFKPSMSKAFTAKYLML